jgi:hypothetical protein
MMQQLPAAQRKYLAIALLIFSVFLLTILVFRPLWNQYANGQAEVEQTRDHISRFESIQLRAKDNQRLLEELQGYASVAQYLLSGGSSDLAAARLQQKIKSIIVNAGGQLVSTRKLALDAGALLQPVGVRVKMRADINAIKKILHAFESHVPLLKVDEVAMIQRNRSSDSRRRSSHTNTAPVIEMRFNVSGYLELVGDKQ